MLPHLAYNTPLTTLFQQHFVSCYNHSMNIYTHKNICYYHYRRLIPIPIPIGVPWEWDFHRISHSHAHL